MLLSFDTSVGGYVAGAVSCNIVLLSFMFYCRWNHGISLTCVRASVLLLAFAEHVLRITLPGVACFGCTCMYAYFFSVTWPCLVSEGNFFLRH